MISKNKSIETSVSAHPPDRMQICAQREQNVLQIARKMRQPYLKVSGNRPDVIQLTTLFSKLCTIGDWNRNSCTDECACASIIDQLCLHVWILRISSLAMRRWRILLGFSRHWRHFCANKRLLLFFASSLDWSHSALCCERLPVNDKIFTCVYIKLWVDRSPVLSFTLG